jgi:hypothetical protein
LIDEVDAVNMESERNTQVIRESGGFRGGGGGREGIYG